MRAGALRTRVSIQRPTTTADAVGQRVASWETIARRSGALIMRAGKEVEGSAIQSVTRWELRLRWETLLSGMTPEWRIVTDTQTFDIDSVVNQNNRNRELFLILIEVL